MRPTVLPLLLAAALSGCAANGSAPPLEQLGVADQYSPSTGAGPLSPERLDDCWGWLGDGKLAQLAAQAPDAASRGEIARLYMTLRARQAQTANARAYLAAQQDNLEIARFREEAKLVTARDAVQADAERALAAAAIPALEALNDNDAARIAVLSGQTPALLRDTLTPAGPIPTEPAAIGAGTPSDLLSRRPDLKPGLGLQTEKSRAAYRRAVLDAIAAVETAQGSFDGYVAQARALSDAAEKVDALAQLTRKQYRDGLAPYTDLSAAEAALLRARDALAQARGKRAAASIDLCIALGGGR